jgi:hypothetical protein
MHAADSDPPGCAGVAVGRAYGAVLTPRVVKRCARACDRVRDDEISRTEDAEDVADPQRADRLADDVGNRAGVVGGGDGSGSFTRRRIDPSRSS